MNHLVSILLPAYNCEQYIAQTIDSILQQTYQHFELLIINDASTDKTVSIIHQYTDSRIVLVNNPQNLGLRSTLNKGLQLAKGKYIARVDADDVCVPTRIEKQVNYLQQHSHVAVVASQVELIDEQNKSIGFWQLDKQCTTPQQIKKTMLWQSCIAHPSVMFNVAITKDYQYNKLQKHTEDYDLWLQLLANGKTIAKIPEVLLLYRVHNQSVTGSFHRKKNPFFTNANTKKIFLNGRIQQRKWSLFETQLLCTLCYDVAMGIAKTIKQIFVQ